jgi:hypothetical protein
VSEVAHHGKQHAQHLTTNLLQCTQPQIASSFRVSPMRVKYPHLSRCSLLCIEGDSSSSSGSQGTPDANLQTYTRTHMSHSPQQCIHNQLHCEAVAQLPSDRSACVLHRPAHFLPVCWMHQGVEHAAAVQHAQMFSQAGEESSQ